MRHLLLVPLACVACIAKEPGTSLGTYAVTASLKTQTCGATMQTQIEDPWKFDVRLSRSGYVLFWLQAAAPPISGIVDPSGNVTLTTTQTYDLSVNDAGTGCSVVRTDTFKAALGTDADPKDFTGTIAYHYELAEGAVCGGLLAGQFDAVPCDVSYDLTAKRSTP
jgi:hypothetical protein